MAKGPTGTKVRINRDVRALRVRVIGPDGAQLGVMPSKEAYFKAQDLGLDLVEISPNASPPVCKIIDYGKYRYEQTKKERESKKSQHQIKVKEVKLKPNIDEHDLQVKLKRAKEFLEKGNKVKITCMFRGREMLHTDVGRKVVDRFCDELVEVGSPESRAKMMGRSLSLVMAPQIKKK
ncbi:MAG: translation initiation factor IF-3 [Simkaniaceae bacterium]